MFCPQCGTESTARQPYCRSCGANLKVIGKAVALGEAIGRTDRGPVPKIKEIVKNLKVDHVTEEVSHAFDQVRTEIARNMGDQIKRRAGHPWRRQKTAAERRERLRVKGTVSIFSGTGLTLFLYYLTHALNLHLPPEVIAAVPFEIDPVVRVFWLVGLIPVFSGFGRLLAAMAIKPDKQVSEAEPPKPLDAPPLQVDSDLHVYQPPASVTDRTTNILDHVKRGAQ